MGQWQRHGQAFVIVLCCTACVLTLLYSSVASSAKAGHEAGSETRTRESAPEELLVTGQSQGVRSLNVSSALSSLSKEQLEQANISHSRDLVKLAPSLSTLQSFNNRQSAFLIRGLGTLIFSAGIEPSVLTMVDGVSVGSAAQGMTPLMDVSHVDIWRGSQVTRFARNAAAGVINLVSERADEQWRGQLRINADSAVNLNSEQLNASLFAGGPLTNTLKARVGITLGDTEGYIANRFDGKALNNERVNALTSKFDWAASDTLHLAFDIRYSDTDAHCCAPVITSAISPQITNTLLPVNPSHENRESNTNTAFVNNVRARSARLSAHWQLDSGYAIEATSAYSRYTEREAQDFDFLPIDFIPLSAGRDTHKQFSRHLALYSPDDRKARFGVGAYFERQRRIRHYERGLLNIESAALDAAIQKDSTAVFANLELNLDAANTLRAGLRNASNELRFLATRDAFVLQGWSALDNVTDSNRDTSLDAEVSWQYDFSNTNTLYVRWSRGHKAPAYNIIFDLDANALEPVRKERGNAWELAYRRIFPVQKVMLNATVYHSRFDDYQAQVQEPGSVKFLLLNSGSIRSHGLELETHWQYHDVQVRAGFDWTVARIGKVQGVLCGSGELMRGECPNGFRNLEGKPLPFAPDLKLNLAIQYNLPITLYGMMLSLDSLHRWQSSMQTSFNNDRWREQGAFGLWNVGISAKTDTLNIRLYVDNVLNKNFALAHFDNPIDAGGYVSFFARQASRGIGLSLNYSF